MQLPFGNTMRRMVHQTTLGEVGLGAEMGEPGVFADPVSDDPEVAAMVGTDPFPSQLLAPWSQNYRMRLALKVNARTNITIISQVMSDSSLYSQKVNFLRHIVLPSSGIHYVDYPLDQPFGKSLQLTLILNLISVPGR